MRLLLLGLVLMGWIAVAEAHFLVLLPDRDSIAAEGDRQVRFRLLFTHPMAQGPAMHLAKPVRFGVQLGDRQIDLLERLQLQPVQGQPAYTASYRLAGPGDHLFFVEPQPYWEAAEQTWIVHYTKVIVDAFGAEDGWWRLIGLPVEIEPLARPYGLWTGNVFRGIVRHQGQPVPFATVEVEYWNDSGVALPGPAFTTQTIRADAQGVFAYALPRAGWWGFAALIPGPPRPGPDGQPAEVELGALLWLRAVDMK